MSPLINRRPIINTERSSENVEPQHFHGAEVIRRSPIEITHPDNPSSIVEDGDFLSPGLPQDFPLDKLLGYKTLMEQLVDSNKMISERLAPKNVLRKSYGQFTLDGAGLINGGAGVQVDTVPHGFYWVVQRLVASRISAGAGNFGFYANSPLSAANLVANVNVSSTQATNLILDQGDMSSMFFPGDTVWVNLTGNAGTAAAFIEFALWIRAFTK